MQRFKNILLMMNPEVQETATLDKAVLLARQNDARLTVFTVIKELSEVSCSVPTIKPEGFVNR